MKRNILANGILLSIVLLNSVGLQSTPSTVSDNPRTETTRTWEPSPASTYSGISANLNTPVHKTISFNAKNQQEEPTQETNKIPHLVLKRNGVLTPGYERALEITVNNVPVYAPGIIVELTITTQHSDPDMGAQGSGITVWRKQQFVPHTGSTQQGVQIKFSVVFNRFIELGNGSIPTPTDYYKYRIAILDMNGNLRQSHTENFAFLLENHWRTPLPKLLESEPGAAPDQLLIYYYDMIPFQVDMQDPTTQIPRVEVEHYIQTILIPAMVEAIQLQSNVWGFPWYPEWRNFRREEDEKTLSVALGEYDLWYHGKASSLGHSMISIRVDGSVAEYDDLTDGLMGIFHHELFHNHQRNMAFHFSDHPNVAGKDEAWKLFSEGTAVLATSVGQPEIELEKTIRARSYMKRASAFIGFDGFVGGGLNKSYENIPYQTTAYWRFLYEKCGGIMNGNEDPATGMKVIRLLLETLYKGEVVDIHSSTESVEYLPAIMDRALTGMESCPFHSYEESLLEFANTIHMLRNNNIECIAPNHQFGCGFHDPNGLYPTPPAQSIQITDKSTMYVNDAIRSSYGIDIIELRFNTNTKVKNVTVLLDRAPNSDAEFAIKMVEVKAMGASRIMAHQDIDEDQGYQWLTTKNGRATMEISSINTNIYNGLSLVIVRTDSLEKLDNTGGYTIQILIQ